MLFHKTTGSRRKLLARRDGSDTVYVPPERIVKEAPKWMEQFDKIRIEVLVAWKEDFFS